MFDGGVEDIEVEAVEVCGEVSAVGMAVFAGPCYSFLSCLAVKSNPFFTKILLLVVVVCILT
jgi:hypothetical protein